MSFIPSAVIESRAAELWRSYGLDVAFDVEAFVDDLGLSVLWEQVNDLDSEHVFAMLDPRDRRVILNERHLELFEENHGLLRFTLAHEVGHWILHSEAARTGSLELFRDGRIWCRNNSIHPTERQAERFAAALLTPRDILKTALPPGGVSGWGSVYGLASRFAVSPSAMLVRLEELGWAHRGKSGEPRRGPASIEGQERLFN